MPIDYSLSAFPKHTPSVLQDDAKRRRVQAALDRCYDAVDRRDGKVCRVTGIPLTHKHEDKARRLTRDHLGPRSTYPEDKFNPDNVLTVSWRVHEYLQSSSLIPVDKRGQETRRVSKIHRFEWNRRLVEAGKEPFRIRWIPR